MKKVIFRADGDSVTGLGHIMRSSALMQILQNHFSCEFWTKNLNFFPVKDFETLPLIKELFHSSFNEEVDYLAQTIPKNSVIVLDGYQFNTSYQRTLKKAGFNLVCIDDILNYHFVADVVINHAGGINRTAYSCEQYTKIFLGPSYALIKPLFCNAQRNHVIRNKKNILISLGGADPKNNTEKIVENIIALNFFEEINVLIGAANKYIDQLKEKFCVRPDVVFHQNLNVQGVFNLMCHCSTAVLTPSTVCYEYMSIGGIVYLYQIADNQKKINEFFLNEKMAFTFERIGRVSEHEQVLSLNRQSIVLDSKSCNRLLEIFQGLNNAN